jgi:redox-sensitive bicupin YhaK (pirin superfamily)
LQIIEPAIHDLGGFTVGRLLPHASLRSVGPFVFFDHIGPATLAADSPIAVRPHPHIGIATVTYLWEGSMMHRDSLGVVQEIQPGDVNWMTAGRGIVHSERTPERLLGVEQAFHGLQTWVALPREFEEAEPAFVHHPRASLPVVERPGVTLTVVAGHAFGVRSPVAVLVDTLYVSIDVQAGRSVHIPTEHVERALFPVVGELEVEGVTLPLGSLALLGPGEVVMTARSDARVMLVGGAPLDGPRHMFWNFVHSSRERIEQAKEDWRAGRFAAVPGETEFIPLP